MVCAGATLVGRGLLTLRRDKYAPKAKAASRFGLRLPIVVRGWPTCVVGVLIALNGIMVAYYGAGKLYSDTASRLGLPSAIIRGDDSLHLGWFDWIGAGVLGFGSGLLIFALLARRWRHQHRCRKCKYDMRQTEGAICPECGLDRTKRYRRWKLAMIAVLVMLGWPTGLFAESSIKGYHEYGKYGLVPKWVLIAGINVLPEDLIFGTTELNAWGYPTGGSLADRLNRESFSDSQRFRIWRGIRDEIADPSTLAAELHLLIAMAIAVSDAEMAFPDPQHQATQRARDFLGREFLDLALGGAPVFEKALMAGGWARTIDGTSARLARIAGPMVAEPDIDPLFARLSRIDLSAWAASEILFRADQLHDQIEHRIETGIREHQPLAQSGLVVGLAGSLAHEDAGFAERLLLLVERDDPSAQAVAILCLHPRSTYDTRHRPHGVRYRVACDPSRYAISVQAAMDTEDHDLLAAALGASSLLAVDGSYSIDREALDRNWHRLFTLLRNDQFTGNTTGSGTLGLTLWRDSEYLVQHAPAAQRVFAAESVLIWMMRDQFAVPAFARDSFLDLMRLDESLTVRGLVKLADDLRWDDADLDPADWLPAAIEAAKARAANGP